MAPPTLKRTPKALRPEHGRGLVAHDALVKDLEDQLEEAKADRKAYREHLAPHLPDREDVKAGRFRIRRTSVDGQRTFSLTAYEGKHTITPEMQDHIGCSSGYDRWTVEEIPRAAAN